MRATVTVALLAFACVFCATPRVPHMAGAKPASRQCTVRGPLPDPACTPGAVETTDAAVVCGQSTRERRNVPSSVHRQVFADYGIDYPQPTGAYEVDHLISLELGGSNDVTNLWPEAAEPSPGFHDKDRVENALHARVCAGEMKLEDAQALIRTDWLRAR